MNPEALHRLDLVQRAMGLLPSGVDYDSIREKGENGREIRCHLREIIEKNWGEHRTEELVNPYQATRWAKNLARDLYDDILGSLREAHHQERAHQSALAFLPHMGVDAFCEAYGPKCYGIGINWGLHRLLAALAECLLLAAEGDEASARELYAMSFRNGWVSLAKSEPALARAATSGSISSTTLRFVGLHEVGHLVHGHPQEWGTRFHAASHDVIYDHPMSLPAKWEAEWLVDQFAFDRMIETTGGPEQMWINTLHICMMFEFFSDQNRCRGTSGCKAHPPPRDRAQRLRAHLASKVGPDPTGALNWMDTLLLEWRGNSMQEIRIQIYTEDPEEFDRLNDLHGHEVGLELRRIEESGRPALWETAKACEFALNIAGGVISSLAASWLWEKLNAHKRNAVVIDGEVAKTLEECKKILSRIDVNLKKDKAK